MRARLFAIGVVLGAALFLLGGTAVVPAHSVEQPGVCLAHWLEVAAHYPQPQCP